MIYNADFLSKRRSGIFSDIYSQEYPVLEKSFDTKENYFEKGGKRAQIGEVRMWGAEKWVKHQDGWVNINEKSGKSTLERPGGKREAASDEHTNHAKQHLDRHTREGSVHEKQLPNQEYKRKEYSLEDSIFTNSEGIHQFVSPVSGRVVNESKSGESKEDFAKRIREKIKEAESAGEDEENKKAFPIGTKVTIKNHGKYDSMKSHDSTQDGVVDGHFGGKVRVIHGSGSTNAETKDLSKTEFNKESVSSEKIEPVYSKDIVGDKSTLKKSVDLLIKSLKFAGVKSIDIRESRMSKYSIADIISIQTESGDTIQRIVDYKHFGKLDMEKPTFIDILQLKTTDGNVKKTFGHTFYDGKTTNSVDTLNSISKNKIKLPNNSEVVEAQSKMKDLIKNNFNIDLSSFGSYTNGTFKDYLESDTISSDGSISYGGSTQTPGKTAKITLNMSTGKATLTYGRYTSNVGSSYQQSSIEVPFDITKTHSESIEALMSSSKWNQIKQPIDKEYGRYSKNFTDYIRSGGRLD